MQIANLEIQEKKGLGLNQLIKIKLNNDKKKQRTRALLRPVQVELNVSCFVPSDHF
jgi:hypothetical protein